MSLSWGHYHRRENHHFHYPRCHPLVRNRCRYPYLRSNHSPNLQSRHLRDCRRRRRFCDLAGLMTSALHQECLAVLLRPQVSMAPVQAVLQDVHLL